jgi:formylglycine-generating enzyme required for sulfatase activity
MDKKLFNRCKAMLLKHIPESVAGRRAFVTSALFGEKRLIGKIGNYDSEPETFVTLLLTEADAYQRMDDGRYATVALLEEVSEQYAGLEDRQIIVTLTNEILTRVGAPLVASPPQKPRSPHGTPLQSAPDGKLTPFSQLMPTPFAWIDIPAGKVMLESGGYLKTRTTFDVSAFKIAKYPVTNAQFEVFVQHSNGYRNPAWWDYSDEAKKWRAKNPQPQKTAFIGDTLPRTNVTWYESVAFCRWMTAFTGENVTLPTEQQWQRAAQGDEGRRYPWGNNWDETRCNNAESKGLSGDGLGVKQYPAGHGKQTTPVDAYPNGASPFGVLDMSGNVFEWCLTGWETGANDIDRTDYRLLRGASWSCSDTSFFRAVPRYRINPYNANNDRGVRFALF